MGFSRQEYWSGVPLPSLEIKHSPPIILNSFLTFHCGVWLSLNASYTGSNTVISPSFFLDQWKWNKVYWIQFMEKSVFIYYFAIGRYFGLLKIRMHFWTWKLWKCSSHMSHCREHNWLTAPALSLWVCPHIYAKVMLWPVLGQWLNLARICRQGCLCDLQVTHQNLELAWRKLF